MMQSIISLIKRHYLLIIFGLGYIVFSAHFAKSIGIPWDESDVYSRGRVLGEYLAGRIGYAQYASDTLGLMYDHLYSLMVNSLNFKKTYGGFHFINLMFAGLGYIASYGLVYSQTRKQGSAIWGPILLWISTRFSGEAPINPKDMPMAVMYLVSLWIITISSNWKTWHRSMILGIVIGLTATTRIVGLTLLPIVALCDWGDVKQGEWMKRVGSYLAMFIIAISILYITWPYMANSFPDHVLPILQATKKYAWDGLVLYGGQRISATKLPWTYIPIWILITAPLSVLVLFIFSLYKLPTLCHSKAYKALFLALVMNTGLYLVMRPVVYDGFRHFLFLLPIISTMAAIGMTKLTGYFRYVVIGAIVPVIFSIWQLYPYQYTYFNELVGGLHGAQSRYETDYFGISHKEAVVWLSHNLPDSKRIYSIATCGQTISSTHYFSPQMQWVPKVEMADYLVCYTRFGEHLAVPDKNIVFTVERQGVPLAYVKKVH